jgi:Transposase DDE domain
MEDVGALSSSRQAGKTACGRSDCHFRHPACVENRMPLARRSASLWATDDYLQSLQSLVPAPYLAAHFRENGGRRSRSGRAFHRQQPCQGAPLGGCFKKGEFAEAIGRSRGGRTSKIPALADDRGSPIAVALTPGNVADITMAAPLLGAVARPKRLLADKAYDADCLRKWLKQRKRSKQSFHPPPHAGRPILWTAGPTNAEISSHECAASSRTGDASQPEMTAMRKTISLVSPSQP